ncbi:MULTISPECIES: hypothetical protein [Bacillus]|uniref:Uncharacterized protein n=2 Tax=Bacillus cereus group TaxID=86661 RepID=A0A2A7D6J3_BACAN|nr:MULTISPECIES: hypothetical protein [Bacillus]MCP1163377.1 hypothetical protein [Bacillus sp. 1813sda1]MDC7972641.1 hypothetical protein [Bacillus sp. BLCC-B18]OTW64904.1 hypothetical protein BK707_29010 [Bacillus thuringiensis serovar coreanensis]OTX49266.1 hypothetical protein BK724_07280 [Bacillus thuringiensis serovar sooncheon]OTX57557.1 hypothetical protein BK725_07200 [Bacillus thuringiensis serovar guiyangiensis]
MQSLKAGKYITYVAIAIFLVVAIMSPYELPKKVGFIIGVLILGACALGTNKIYEKMYSKFKHK